MPVNSNSGKKLVFCKKCQAKRYALKTSIPNHNFKWTCSKGHSWVVEGVTVERVAAAMQDVFNASFMKKLFEKDDVFFARLKTK